MEKLPELPDSKVFARPAAPGVYYAQFRIVDDPQ